MPDLILAFSAVFAFMGFGAGTISLVFHWVRRKEHPDVSEVRAEIHQVQRDYIDLMDKVNYWVKRDRVRNIREAKEAEKTQPDSLQAPVNDAKGRKAILRQRLAAAIAAARTQ